MKKNQGEVCRNEWLALERSSEDVRVERHVVVLRLQRRWWYCCWRA